MDLPIPAPLPSRPLPNTPIAQPRQAVAGREASAWTRARKAAGFALLSFAMASASAASADPAAAAPPPPGSATAASLSTRALHTLFDTAWQARLQRQPEFATTLGDHRHGDRLANASPQAEAAEFADWRRWRQQALAIDPALLSPLDRVSRELFIAQLDDELRFEPLVGMRRMTLAAQGGFHESLADLLIATPVQTSAQVAQLLARLQAYPRRVDQELVRLREGMALGWVPAHPVLQRVLASIDAQLATSGDASPFFQPFTRLGSQIPEAKRKTLRARGRQLITGQVLPAQQRLRDFVAGAYLARAPEQGGLWRYPGGADAYAATVAQHTTTRLSPAEVHALGLREVAALRRGIDEVMAELGWHGDFASFAVHMNTDPRYLHPGPQALLASYQAIARRIEARLPRLFDPLPRAAHGVRAMPAFGDPDRAEYYDPPPLDGSSPGWFNINALAWRSRPRWGQETLTAHELMPGHHLQIATANELGALPAFRRTAWHTAYGEGWALYAETLGPELGLYQDPASRYGHLQSLMFRAARLVVDTGLHAKGWSRTQAIDYMQAQTGDERATIESEIDRYLAWPGQALGYMVGKLHIEALRDRARNALGQRFDIRAFHRVVLGGGSLPLGVLEREVDAWIAAEVARP
jgi:uncharacterized protein (DUF885 family)